MPSCLTMLPPPSASLCPYTTLFRSGRPASAARRPRRNARPASARSAARPGRPPCAAASRRSEEHTSELQSRGHLVCRLLLEKKKVTTKLNYHTTTLLLPQAVSDTAQ